MLHLPDVAELVGDEIVRDVVRAQEDDPVEGIAVEPAEPRQPEEPRGREEPDSLDPHRRRPPVEPVEPCLGGYEPGIQQCGSQRPSFEADVRATLDYGPSPRTTGA